MSDCALVSCVDRQYACGDVDPVNIDASKFVPTPHQLVQYETLRNRPLPHLRIRLKLLQTFNAMLAKLLPFINIRCVIVVLYMHTSSHRHPHLLLLIFPSAVVPIRNHRWRDWFEVPVASFSGRPRVRCGTKCCRVQITVPPLRLVIFVSALTDLLPQNYVKGLESIRKAGDLSLDKLSDN